ncbi:AAA family ATPase [Candidatus Saccharibacteria bacterium]|nr:AAA family ATPase [Candidatus Saccharibacteria bacterium]
MATAPEVHLEDIFPLQDPSVLLMIGAPFSGKSEIAHQLSSMLSVALVSRESLLYAIPEDELVEGKSPAFTNVLWAIQDGRSVVYDATNCFQQNRRKDAKAFHGAGAKSVIGIQTASPLELLQNRNRALGWKIPPSHVRNYYRQLQQNPVGVNDELDAYVILETSQYVLTKTALAKTVER